MHTSTFLIWLFYPFFDFRSPNIQQTQPDKHFFLDPLLFNLTSLMLWWPAESMQAQIEWYLVFSATWDMAPWPTISHTSRRRYCTLRSLQTTSPKFCKCLCPRTVSKHARSIQQSSHSAFHSLSFRCCWATRRLDWCWNALHECTMLYEPSGWWQQHQKRY